MKLLLTIAIFIARKINEIFVQPIKALSEIAKDFGKDFIEHKWYYNFLIAFVIYALLCAIGFGLEIFVFTDSKLTPLLLNIFFLWPLLGGYFIFAVVFGGILSYMILALILLFAYFNVFPGLRYFIMSNWIAANIYAKRNKYCVVYFYNCGYTCLVLPNKHVHKVDSLLRHKLIKIRPFKIDYENTEYSYFSVRKFKDKFNAEILNEPSMMYNIRYNIHLFFKRWANSFS